MEHFERDYLQVWYLSGPDGAEAAVFLWEGGEDVTVDGGHGEAFSFTQARDVVVESLIPSYVQEGWTVTGHDSGGGTAYRYLGGAS